MTVKKRMQSSTDPTDPTDRTDTNASPDSASQQSANTGPFSPANLANAANSATILKVFQPYKPPLRERKLAQTALGVTLFLLAGIGFAAVTVWMFLPSMLPKLPLTFL